MLALAASYASSMSDEVAATEALAPQGAPEPGAIAELPPDPPKVKMWRAEVERLREMIADQEHTGVKLIWVMYVGGVLCIPAAFYHVAAALGVLVFAFVTYWTGRYFSWGHIIERAYQLKMAEEQLEKECIAAGLPVPPPINLPDVA